MPDEVKSFHINWIPNFFVVLHCKVSMQAGIILNFILNFRQEHVLDKFLILWSRANPFYFDVTVSIEYMSWKYCVHLFDKGKGAKLWNLHKNEIIEEHDYKDLIFLWSIFMCTIQCMFNSNKTHWRHLLQLITYVIIV